MGAFLQSERFAGRVCLCANPIWHLLLLHRLPLFVSASLRCGGKRGVVKKNRGRKRAREKEKRTAGTDGPKPDRTWNFRPTWSRAGGLGVLTRGGGGARDGEGGGGVGGLIWTRELYEQGPCCPSGCRLQPSSSSSSSCSSSPTPHPSIFLLFSLYVFSLSLSLTFFPLDRPIKRRLVPALLHVRPAQAIQSN